MKCAEVTGKGGGHSAHFSLNPPPLPPCLVTQKSLYAERPANMSGRALSFLLCLSSLEGNIDCTRRVSLPIESLISVTSATSRHQSWSFVSNGQTYHQGPRPSVELHVKSQIQKAIIDIDRWDRHNLETVMAGIYGLIL